MPPKLDPEFVRQQFIKYGYRVPDDFKYTNNKAKYKMYDLVMKQYVTITYQLLKQLISRGNRVPYKPKNSDSFNKWLKKHGDDDVSRMNHQEQRLQFKSKNKYIKLLKKKKDFTIEFNDYTKRDMILAGFIEAAKIVIPSFTDTTVRLTLLDSWGTPSYRFLNYNTVKFLDKYFRDSSAERNHDTNEDVIDMWDLSQIDVEFMPYEPKFGGLFPFKNVSSIDLQKYGIYRYDSRSELCEANDNDSIEKYDSCIYHSIKVSQVLTDNELSLLKSFIITRYVPQKQLSDIASTFNLFIKVHKIYPNNGKSSNNTYGDPSTPSSRHIELLNIYNHYMFNDTVNVTEFYIKHIHEIDSDPLFISHPRKTLLKRYSPGKTEYAKEGISLSKCIRLMIKHELLIPLSHEEFVSTFSKFNLSECTTEGISRKIHIADKNYNFPSWYKRVNQTHKFFGYEPEIDEIPDRLNELQAVIDSLPLRHHVDVSLYYKFSELMQKVMYEYGCYDDVYELSGTTASRIRNQCVFPKHDKSPFYSNEKLYYIDLNGAYMSCIEGIPTGYPPFSNSPMNTKIKSLINELYIARSKANPKLSKTLKFMMNSCWGYSIRRAKYFTHEYKSDIDKYIKEVGPYVVGYKYINDSGCGYVNVINSFTPHFTIPQFAKSVLDTFNKKMNEIKSIVNVLYQNVDAILINESDYKKLLDMNYIGDSLGQFKIEHVFTEFALRGGRQYVATLENGDKYHHCVKKDVDYDSFVNEVKNKIHSL